MYLIKLYSFSENGCSENYVPIANKYCIRISAYPEKFDQAVEKCDSEGGFLLQYTSEEIHQGLSSSIKKLKKTLPRFGNVDKYWIGADFGTSGWDW